MGWPSKYLPEIASLHNCCWITVIFVLLVIRKTLFQSADFLAEKQTLAGGTSGWSHAGELICHFHDEKSTEKTTVLAEEFVEKTSSTCHVSEVCRNSWRNWWNHVLLWCPETMLGWCPGNLFDDPWLVHNPDFVAPLHLIFACENGHSGCSLSLLPTRFLSPIFDSKTATRYANLKHGNNIHQPIFPWNKGSHFPY